MDETMEAARRVPQLGRDVVRRLAGEDAASQTATLVATAAAGSSFAHGGVAAGVRRLGPEIRLYAGAAGHLVSLGALAGGVLAGIEYANRKAEFGGAGIEAAYRAPPDAQTVSGGPASGRGDCATVALQYSLRPSFLSMDRVRVGREQNRALFHALEWRLRAMPAEKRPRLVGFGESLGAQTLQDVFLDEGAHGFHRVGVDRALFLGTPATSKWAEQWRLSPEAIDSGGEVVEIASYDEWVTTDARDRDGHRYFLLSHHEDPITRFEPALAVQQPAWLGQPQQRPPGVPRVTHWHFITTFFLTGIDMVNAMHVVPGSFMARGHDYRADLARMVSVAFGLAVEDAELLRIERSLRRREAGWAERRMVAEQLQRAKAKARRVVSVGSP